MGATYSGAATRGCRAATRMTIAAAIALLVLALLASSAAAQPVAPEAVLTGTPSAATNDASPAFAFTARNAADATRFECRLDDALVACAATGASGSYAAAGIAEGRHTFSVRATNAEDPGADDWGPTATYTFRVDRTAPVVTIAPPSSHTAVGGALRLHFSADEPGVAFTCRVDGAAAVACAAPHDFVLAPGDHTITLRGTDEAGNASAPVTWDVTAVAAAAPALGPSAAAPVAAPARVPRIAIGTACVEVSAARASARFSLRGRDAIVRFRAPAAARYAIFTLRKASGGRRGAVVATVAALRVAGAGTARIALTRGERRLIRSGATRLAVAYSTCRSQAGDWQWVGTGATA
jgi:hypothetical protein